MRTKEEKNAYLKQWRLNNPDKVKAANKRKYERDKTERPDRLEQKRNKSKDWVQKNKSKHREYQREWSRCKLGKIKEQVFDKLGHSCCKCGFSDKRALCIDHIKGGGFSELRSTGVFNYYQKVLNDKDGLYQILCHNCNWIKRHENGEHRKPCF